MVKQWRLTWCTRVGTLILSLMPHIFRVTSWTPSSGAIIKATRRKLLLQNKLQQLLHSNNLSTRSKSQFTSLYKIQSVLSSSQVDLDDFPTKKDPVFSQEERHQIESIFDRCQEANDSESLRSILMGILPTLPPALLLKLRQAEGDPNTTIQAVSKHVNMILEQQLDIAKTTLSEMLNAGEIRKLDSLIGQAARDGKLDAAFFNVLTINLKDAKESDQVPTEDGAATRHQILTHIYTRCQEEAEKNIPPGTALLNKLLRTQEASIRKNLYEHYLTPQPNIISAPDGSKLDLGEKPVLVPLEQFTEAIDGAVLQIRNVETAGGFDKESAAMMVESCRQVAKEARIVIGEKYGAHSKELQHWEDALEPVFRPKSPDSPYIKGEFKT